jgi:hypothetical protein
MKIQLEQTYVGQASNIKEYGKNVRQFLINNENRITFNHDEEEKLLITHDPMTHTVMSDLYKQALYEKKMGIIRPIILNNVDKIPSWFLISWLDIDTLALRETDKQSADIINSISKFKEKILVDITPFYNENSRIIKDTGGFYNRIVRNLLCRSYYLDKQGWLTPNIIYSLTKMYATIISTKIGRVYNLSYQEQLVIMTILSAFFTSKCYNTNEVIQPVMSKMDFIRAVDVHSIYDFIKEKYTTNTFDLKAVIDCIVELGPSRLNNFNLSTFFNMNLNITNNQSISLLALEYPPYWAYIILSALSGDKTSLYHSIKSLKLDRDAMVLKNDIVKTSSFIHSL